MGLDSVVMYANPETGEYVNTIPNDIAEEIFSLCPNIIGIGGKSKSTYVSFRGKAYAYIVNKIAETNLYRDLEPEQIAQLYQRFCEFNKNHQERFEGLDQVFKSDGWQITDWVETITNEYVPAPCEVDQLEKLFGICVKYNLMIHASY